MILNWWCIIVTNISVIICALSIMKFRKERWLSEVRVSQLYSRLDALEWQFMACKHCKTLIDAKNDSGMKL